MFGMLGGAIRVALNVLKKYIKVPVVKALNKTAFGRFVVKGVSSFGTRMATNMASKRWWGRTIAILRTSRFMISSIGKVGRSLKKIGGPLGWLGKGLTLFDYDPRTPKEFRRDMKEKEKQISKLANQSRKIAENARKIQKELMESDLNLDEFETTDEKLNAIGEELNRIRKAVGKGNETSYNSDIKVTALSKFQEQSFRALGDAIVTGDQKNMQITLAAVEENKEATMAVIADSTSNAVGEITAQMNELNEQRKQEEEFRRKNDWKRQVFWTVLRILDWILNWPFKLAGILTVIVGTFIGMLMVKYEKFFYGVINFVTNTYLTLKGMFKVLQAIYYLGKNILSSIIGVVGTIMDLVWDLGAFLVKKLTLGGIDMGYRSNIFKGTTGEGSLDAYYETSNEALEDFKKVWDEMGEIRFVNYDRNSGAGVVSAFTGGAVTASPHELMNETLDAISAKASSISQQVSGIASNSYDVAMAAGSNMSESVSETVTAALDKWNEKKNESAVSAGGDLKVSRDQITAEKVKEKRIAEEEEAKSKDKEKQGDSKLEEIKESIGKLAEGMTNLVATTSDKPPITVNIPNNVDPSPPTSDAPNNNINY